MFARLRHVAFHMITLLKVSAKRFYSQSYGTQIHIYIVHNDSRPVYYLSLGKCCVNPEKDVLSAGHFTKYSRNFLEKGYIK